MPSLMLSGIMFPAELLPKALTNAGYALPATWGLKLMIGTDLEILSFLPLLAFLIAAVIISGYKLAKIGID